MGYISMNPTKNIKIIGQKVERICAKTISFNDILKFKEIILDKDDITVKYFIMTQVYTGARYQEVAALTLDDVLYDSQQLRINKAYEYAKTRRFKEPKSPAGYRNIDINKKLIDLLNIHKLRLDKLVETKKIRNKFILFFSKHARWIANIQFLCQYIFKRDMQRGKH